MKIGFVLDSGKFGGAEKQAYLLGRELHRSGHKVCYFYLLRQDSSYLETLLASHGIKYYDLNFRFSSTHHRRVFNCLKLAFSLRLYHIDVLLPYTIRPNVNVNFAWQLTGAKICIWNQRDLGFGFSDKYRDRILWFALRNTSGFISNSRAGLEFLRSYAPSRKPSIQIRNGVEFLQMTKPRSLKSKLKIREVDFVVVMLANMTRHKDHITLLQAWKALSIPNGKLILAGTHGETYPTIHQYIAANSLEASVLSPGPLESAEILEIADLTVLSSSSEGMPNSILEAMALSIPIIGTRVSGLIELLGDDYDYLFEPGDHQCLAEMISSIYENSSLRTEIGRSCAKKLHKGFSTHTLTKETLEFINGLLHDQD